MLCWRRRKAERADEVYTPGASELIVLKISTNANPRALGRLQDGRGPIDLLSDIGTKLWRPRRIEVFDGCDDQGERGTLSPSAPAHPPS